MEMEFKDDTIILDGKVINNLDKFVLGFVKTLEKYTDYVIVSGYPAIFFGRTRATEDVDIIIKRGKIREFLEEITSQGYWILNTSSIKEALEILNDKTPIRIAKEGKIIPNFELKYSWDEPDHYSLENRIKVKFNGNKIFFSPIEIQIAYKLKLGSKGNEKDIEDAIHLFSLFKDTINTPKLKDLIEDFSVRSVVEKYLGEIYD